MLEREPYESGNIVHVELVHHATPIGLYRLRRKKERRSGFGGRFPFCYELENLPLAAAQAVERRCRATLAQILVDHRPDNFLTEVPSSRLDGANGGDNLGAGRFFEHVALRAGLERAKDMLGGR